MDLSHILSIAERIKNAQNYCLNEANTKTSLILPFLQVMGYDVFNHNEVAQEYTAEFGNKKGEKVDIAILQENNPIILIECKALGDTLDIKRCSQLFRYFNTQPTARIGILTDGNRYLFFSDLERRNIMDDKPFLEIDILNFNERILPELQKLTKEAWDLDSALTSASVLKYSREIKLLMIDDMQNPSDTLVKYYASQCYNGKLTQRNIEIFRPIVKRAFNDYISEIISKRFNSIRDEDNNQSRDDDKTKDEMPIIHHDSEIITYNNEILAYYIIKTLLNDEVNPDRIAIKDRKTYCGIILDNNIRKPICRLYNVIDGDGGGVGKNAYIIIFTPESVRGERHSLNSLDDIYPLQYLLKSALSQYITINDE